MVLAAMFLWAVLTLVGAVVGQAWEFMRRVVPIVLVCAVVLAAVMGGLWPIENGARTEASPAR